MELFLTRRFIKRFESLPKQVQERIRKALERIQADPYAGKHLSGGLEGEISWRVGDYRILYSIEGGCVYAESVGHRREVYH